MSPNLQMCNSCRVIQDMQSRVELKYFILRWIFIFLEKCFHFLNNSLLSLGEAITSNSFPTHEAAHLQVCSATCPWEVSLSTCWYRAVYLRCAQRLKPSILQTFVIWHLTFHNLNYFSILIFYVYFNGLKIIKIKILIKYY